MVDLAAFARAVQPGDRVAAVMWANNVTGAVQPVAELAAICAERGVPLHVDAVQAAASLAIDFAACGAETLALSAHKLNGPKGVGALVARDPSRIRPLIFGGGQEGGHRSGTENVAGVVGFAAALEAARSRRIAAGGCATGMEAALPELSPVSRPAPNGCPATRCCWWRACAPTCWCSRSTRPASPCRPGAPVPAATTSPVRC